MWRQGDLATHQAWYDVNAYDSFMKRHLQHYGYYTGKNETYRDSLPAFVDWESDSKRYSNTNDNSSDSEYENKALKKEQVNKWDEFLKSTQLVYDYQAGKLVPRLREPRQLYAQSKELGPQQAARWPIEIQVIPERVKHIEYVPSNPEPLYSRTGQEKSPYISGEEGGGRLVYSYEPAAGPFFIRSRVGGHRAGCQEAAVRLETEHDVTLQFESRFESGNLAKAVQVGQFEYELWLRNDLYTDKHTQWFYFQLKNTKPNVTYTLTIVNLMKSDSLYNQGMRPLLYSEKMASQRGVGWHRFASAINYYKNNKRYQMKKTDRNYYGLTWTCRFPYEDDTVYVAHCYPYTYTDLQDYLGSIINDPVKSTMCKQRILCRTLAGNLVYLLTITAPSNSPEESRLKKAVVITSRVHPGETNASWMMKGFLDFLTGNSPDAKVLRETFIFKVVPMLNPDGVIVGNYRCSLAGRDLNRNYKTVLKDSFPPVWHTKTMIKKLLEERSIAVYCDLHGHSRKQNVFIYGCDNKDDTEWRLRERVFPVMLSRNAIDKFTYDGCKFKVQKSKEGTGRIVVWRLGVKNSYTMEATFCGSSLGARKGQHFTTADYESMGAHFCETLLDYCDPDPTKEKLRRDILSKLMKQGQSVSLDDVTLSDDVITDGGSSDSGCSDSSGSDGLPVHLQFMAQKFAMKKKKLKSRKDRDKNLASTSRSGAPAPAEPERRPHQNCKHSHTAVPYKDQVKPASHVSGQARIVASTTSVSQRAALLYRHRCKPKPDNIESESAENLEVLTTSFTKSGFLDPIECPQEDVPHFRYSNTAADAAAVVTRSHEGLEGHGGHECHESRGGNADMAMEWRAPPTVQLRVNVANSEEKVRPRTHCAHYNDQSSSPMRVQNIELRDRYRLMTVPTSVSALDVEQVTTMNLNVLTLKLGQSDESYSRSVRHGPVVVRAGVRHGDPLQAMEVRPTQRHLLELAVAQQKRNEALQTDSRKQLIEDQRQKAALQRAQKHASQLESQAARTSSSHHPANVARDYLITRDKGDHGSLLHTGNHNNVKRAGAESSADVVKTTSSANGRSATSNRALSTTSREKHVQSLGTLPSEPYVAQTHETADDINETLHSINELRDSVLHSARYLSPTTGEYIEEMVRRTEAEVSTITAELEGQLRRGGSSLRQTTFNDASEGNRLYETDRRPNPVSNSGVRNSELISTLRRDHSSAEFPRSRAPEIKASNRVENGAVRPCSVSTSEGGVTQTGSWAGDAQSPNARNVTTESKTKSTRFSEHVDIYSGASDSLPKTELNLMHEITKEAEQTWDPAKRTLYPVPNATARSGPRFNVGSRAQERRSSVEANAPITSLVTSGKCDVNANGAGLSRSKTDPNLMMRETQHQQQQQLAMVNDSRPPSASGGADKTGRDRNKMLAHRVSESSLLSHQKSIARTLPTPPQDMAAPTKISLMMSCKHEQEPVAQKSRCQPAPTKGQRPPRVARHKRKS